MSAAINVSNLKKNYGGFEAVKDISFEIEQGEIFGFLGPNGAGKTSTINMLIGLSRPSYGSITIDGIDAVKHVKKMQRIIGVVPDESNLYDEMDGFHNLCFCAGLYGMRKRESEKKARALLKQFNLTDAGTRPFKAYSKGMRRKLTIAAAIIHEPKILFLDEPTTGIDVESARQIRRLILELKQKGTTIFMTTHYIEDAERICDRVAFIAGGKIIDSGSVTELMEKAERGHRIQLTFNENSGFIIGQIKRQFPDLEVNQQGQNICVITSRQRLSLSPVLQFFDSKGVSVFEAKEMRPSLEDVFVSTTGIDVANLKKEKEGGKK